MTTRPPERLVAAPVILRRFRLDDTAPMVKAITESREHLRPWMAWARDEPTEQALEQFISATLASFDAGRGFGYAICAPDDDAIVGGCDLRPAGSPGALAIGYWIHVAHTRKGYAATAASLLAETGLSLRGVRRIEIHCDRTNVASAGVARHAGFRLEGEIAKAPATPAETGWELVWVRERGR